MLIVVLLVVESKRGSVGLGAKTIVLVPLSEVEMAMGRSLLQDTASHCHALLRVGIVLFSTELQYSLSWTVLSSLRVGVQGGDWCLRRWCEGSSVLELVCLARLLACKLAGGGFHRVRGLGDCTGEGLELK